MAYTPRDEKCSTCGRTFLKKSPRSIRCPECQSIQRQSEKRARDLKRYYERTGRKKPVHKPEKYPEQCNVKICKSCRYRDKDTNLGNEGGIYCDYMSITGKSRSSICPAGACTVYEKGNPKKRIKDIALINE